MKKTYKLAIKGGEPEVKIKHPHFTWPPKSSYFEKARLGTQRDIDISIKGSAGPIFELEKLFIKFMENKPRYAVTFNSGTSALLAAYFAIGIGMNDEVIAPAITYHAAISPLFILRANPVLVDVNAKTWCIDPNNIERNITDKTKAITVVHQWGHPADMDKIIKIASRYNLKIIEDCSHAHGSRYKGKLVGTFGDVAVFSLQANKMMFAGEGGILITNTQSVHDRAVLLGHYRDRSRDTIKDPFYQQFWFTGYGLKLRMSPYNAITAIFSLKKLKKRITDRHKSLFYFSKRLAEFPELTVPHIADYAHMGSWYGYKPLYNQKKFHNISREKYIEALQHEGLEVKEPQSDALSRLPLYNLRENGMFHGVIKQKVFTPNQFPVAEKLADSALSFPTFTEWPNSKKIIDSYISAIYKIHKYYYELF